MIPKVIHYFWFGRNPLPENVKVCIESWKKYCPDYEIKRWDEDNFDITQHPYCQEAYAAKKWAFVADYARLKVLYEHGGIYMDTDEEVVNSIDSLLKYRAFIGFESNEAISAGMIGCSPRNEWMKALFRDYDKQHFRKRNGEFDQTTIVTRITRVTTHKYKIELNGEHQMFGDNMALLPVDYLCAKSYETGEICRTAHTLAIQHYNGSWLSDDDKKYLYQYYLYKKRFPWIYRCKGGRIMLKLMAAYNTGGLDWLLRRSENVDFFTYYLIHRSSSFLAGV